MTRSPPRRNDPLPAGIGGNWYWLDRRTPRRVRTWGDLIRSHWLIWRLVKRVGCYEVSTVFLRIDHATPGFDPRPLLFETMVFDRGDDGGLFTWRYSTMAEAESGHAQVVRWVRRLLRGRPRMGGRSLWDRDFSPQVRQPVPASRWRRPSRYGPVDYSRRARGARWQTRRRMRRRAERMQRIIDRPRSGRDRRAAS